MNHYFSLKRILREWFRRDAFYAAFWIGATIGIFFLPVLLGWQSLTDAVPTFYSRIFPDPQIRTLWQVDGGTHTTQIIPYVTAGVRLIKNGIPPLWAAYVGGGTPMAVDIGSELYYPLRILWSLVSTSARAFDLYFLMRFFIAGFGMFLYLKYIGLRRLASLWGGIAYAFTGYFILYLTYPFLDIDALLPWMLLSIEHYFRSPSFHRSAIVGLILGLFILTEHPQATIIAAMFAAVYFIWNAVLRTVTKDDFLLLIRYSLSIIVVALLIASPFIFDFLIDYRQGETVSDWNAKGLAVLPPMRLLHFLVSPTMIPEAAFAGHLLDRYEIIVPYTGVSVMLLFLLSFFLKEKPFPLAPLYAWTGFVILKNIGFPLIQWIGTLPILSQIGWYKAYGPMAGAIVICGTIAFDRLLDEGSSVSFSWKWWGRFLVAIPLLFLLGAFIAPGAFSRAYIPDFDISNRQPELLQKIFDFLSRWPGLARELVLSALNNKGGWFAAILFGEALAAGGITIVIIMLLRRLESRRKAAIALIVLTAFELWWYMPKIRDGFRYFSPYEHTPAYIEFLRERIDASGYARTFSVGNMWNGPLGELYLIPQAQNMAAIKPRRYFSFLPDAIITPDPTSGKISALNPTISAERLPEIPRKFFDAFSIRYLLSETALDPRTGFSPVYKNDLIIYENVSALPMAFVSFEKRSVASPEQARDLFYSSSFDPHTSVILEDRDTVALSPVIIESENLGDAAITEYRSNKVTIRTESNRDAVLVLTDLFYPGWHAYLDGARVPIYPANVMFRAIALPAGAHTVVFKYEPWWFWPSVAASLATLLGVIGAFLYPHLQSYRRDTIRVLK